MVSEPWPAPAKLNLFLHVVGRRADGYHLLQTLFQFLDHGDALRFEITDDGTLELSPELTGVPPESNLILRAALLLQRESGCPLGARIRLEKRLPMGGGLGGGSSDAATALVALNHLWGLNRPGPELEALGLRLGADVPIFVHGRASWAEGVGERLTEARPPEPWYVVLVPECTVDTGAVFRDPELTRNSPPITILDFLSGRSRNDCEALVARRYPPVAAALEWLGREAPARMTGTGACVFAPAAGEQEARALLAQAPMTGFVARGRNRSPLLDRLDAERTGGTSGGNRTP